MDEEQHIVKNIRPVRLKDKSQRKNFTIDQHPDNYESQMVERIRSENTEIKNKGSQYKNNKYSQMFENLSNIISQNNALYKQI